MIEKNTKYHGKFYVVNDSLNKTYFSASLCILDNNKINLELSYSSYIIETVELTNFLNKTYDFYDIQGCILINNNKVDVSLTNCAVSNSNCQISSDAYDEKKCFIHNYLKISAAICVFDILITSTFLIKRGKYKFSALSNWCDSLSNKKSQGSIILESNKNYETVVQNGDKIIIENYFEEIKDSLQVSFVQTGNFNIEFSNSVNILEVIENGRIYNDFFVLMTGQKSNIDKIEVVFDNDLKYYEVYVDRDCCVSSFTNQIYFNFKTLTDNMQIMRNWYEAYKKNNLAYALFFDTIHYREKYLTDILLDAYIRSFEGMFTKYLECKSSFISNNKNKKVIKLIKNTIGNEIDSILETIDENEVMISDYKDKYKKTILDSFAHAYELSLRSRIEYFFQIHENDFKEDFTKYDKNDIISQIVAFRNAYAHADDSKLKDYDIIDFCRFAKKMILVHLFVDILGMKDVQVCLEKMY